MEEKDNKSYTQEAHLRYIIDHYSSENGRTISSRKTYLVFHLGLIAAASIILLWLFPNLKAILLIVIAVIIYLFGKEIGRRDGYVKAYKSLLQYDHEYLLRWKKLRTKEHKKSSITHTEAYENVEKLLNSLDFPLKDDLANEEE